MTRLHKGGLETIGLTYTPIDYLGAVYLSTKSIRTQGALSGAPIGVAGGQSEARRDKLFPFRLH